jgi:hypothetical protein
MIFEDMVIIDIGPDIRKLMPGSRKRINIDLMMQRNPLRRLINCPFGSTAGNIIEKGYFHDVLKAILLVPEITKKRRLDIFPF